MKKLAIFIIATLAFTACSKSFDDIKQEQPDPSKIVFSINVERTDLVITKGIKTSWESGDKIYLFFEDNQSSEDQYAIMTFNGSEWVCTRTGDDFYFSANGKSVTAVYFPSFVNTIEPSLKYGKFIFPYSKMGYFLSGTAKYTMTTVSDVTTVSSSITMTPPEGLVQFFLPASSAIEGTYLLTQEYIASFEFGEVTPGASVSIVKKTDGYAMPGLVTTINGEYGYYFYGILRSDKRGVPTNYEFQLVKQSLSKGYAESSQTKTFSAKTLYTIDSSTGKLMNAAIKFSSPFPPAEKFVDLGYSSNNVKWGTCNLDLNQGDNLTSTPMESGTYFNFGYTDEHQSGQSRYEDSCYQLPNDHDAAYVASSGAWRIPTRNEMLALFQNNNEVDFSGFSWTYDYLRFAYSGLYIRGANGIVLYLPAAGYYYTQKLYDNSQKGYYWTASGGLSNYNAFCLIFSSSNVTITDYDRKEGFPIRPVKE